MRGPRDVAHRAPPGQRARRRQGTLEERPVETRVVRDDQIRARNQRGRGLGVDAPPAQIVVGEPGERGDERIERAGGVVEGDLRLVVQHLADAPVAGRVGKRYELPTFLPLT